MKVNLAVPSSLIPYREMPPSEVIKGLDNAKRLLEIAAAGGHNLLITGPTGSGKSMLGRRLVRLIPNQAAQGVSFRAPRSDISSTAMTGGKDARKPGEISLANNGVLFLDGLEDFRPAVLAAVCRALDDCSPPHGTTEPPEREASPFLLVGTLSDTLTRPRLDRLLARFDLISEVTSPSVEDMFLPSSLTEEVASVERVQLARERQTRRQTDGQSFYLNAHASLADLEQWGAADSEAQTVLYRWASGFSITVRRLRQTLAVARTIADLDDVANIRRRHMVEAIYMFPKFP